MAYTSYNFNLSETYQLRSTRLSTIDLLEEFSPLPVHKLQRPRSQFERNAIYCSIDSQTSSSSLSDCCLVTDSCSWRKNKLPVIGVYWDIENCQVPRHKSAASVVHRVRECFFEGHRQVEFIVVCDVFKENPHIINDLHDAQVNVIHVSARSKNAADEKLRQSLRHFGDTYKPPATVVLISGDINFASDISELRYRKKMRIILLHNPNVSHALKQYADEAYLFSFITENLPSITIKNDEAFQMYINNLPNFETKLLKNRLRLLSDNCGGRVSDICVETGTAIIRFTTLDAANRAQRRLNGEDVFGRKIVAYGVERSATISKSQMRPITYESNSTVGQCGTWQNQQGASRADWRCSLTRPPESAKASVICEPSATLSANSNPVELIFTNLDVSMRNLRSVLHSQLKQFVAVQSLAVNYVDSKPTAIVKVANQQDAEYVISRMHHQKLGYRRISISYLRPKGCHHDELKERVVYLLLEAPTKSIPLYLLLNALETKYLMRVSLCEINKLRDVCQIIEENGERLVTLSAEALAVAPASLQEPQRMHYCCVHCPNGINDVTLWQPEMYQPLYVRMSLRDFGTKLHKLLVSHMGTLPLQSFTICYNAEFTDALPIDNVNGVCLEHLITCVGNVKLKYESAKNKAKFIVWDVMPKPDEPEHLGKNSSPLAKSIGLLRREFVDLLRSEPRCQIPLGKFVPAYHHHFGRQLRVADYGYTKLDDLLHSPHLANVVQVLGEGANRILTLTHSAQMRRFTSDLLRMLKSQVPKQVVVSEFKDVYMRVFHKDFCAFTYGLCALEDLLDEVPENILVLTKDENDITISIPQPVRTASEILRTKQFAEEVVKLLSHSPGNSMLFDKFVPHYHHHFSHQCKVSDYGFTKLIELFEAIPGTVKVEELPNGQRIITLTQEQSLNILGNRIVELLKKQHYVYLPLEQLAQAYMHEYKAALNPQLYNCSGLSEVIAKLSDFITISFSTSGERLVVPVQKDCHPIVELRVWSLLVTPPHNCDANKLLFSYYRRFSGTLSIADLEQLGNVIITRSAGNNYIVFLIPEFVKAAKLYQLLLANSGQMSVSNLEIWYQREYGQQLSMDDGYEKFFNDYSFLFVLSRSRQETSVSLNPKLADLKLPLTVETQTSAAPLWSSTSLEPVASRKVPPKPDTPPALWQQVFSPSYEDMDFSISLPSPVTPLNMPNPGTLISPAKHLLPAHPLGSLINSYPPAPDPNDLPPPDKLLQAGLFVDDSGDSADSGVNSSQITSENEMDNSPEATSCERQKVALLKHFLF